MSSTVMPSTNHLAQAEEATPPAVPESANPPDLKGILSDMLQVLPAAAMSSHPSPAALKHLSPLLRQRVEVLSGFDEEEPKKPWLRFLCYQADQQDQLHDIARSALFEPHPVSGEIEVDWSSTDIDVRYKRIDVESLHAMVILDDFNLFFCLLYCIGDAGGEWRIHEVGVAKPANTNGCLVNKVLEPYYGGSATIAEAETTFKFQESAKNAARETENPAKSGSATAPSSRPNTNPQTPRVDEEEAAYWAQYSRDTPAATPPVYQNQQSMIRPTNGTHSRRSSEDNYYAQYDSVQPALDDHDPDEAAAHNLPTPPPPLGLSSFKPTTNGDTTASNHITLTPPRSQPDRGEDGSSSLAVDISGSAVSRSRSSSQRSENAEGLVHPRPSSSLSSNAGASVANKLELSAELGQREFAVTKHVQSTVRSLFSLCRANGIDRAEFDRMVKNELDLAEMLE